MANVIITEKTDPEETAGGSAEESNEESNN